MQSKRTPKQQSIPHQPSHPPQTKHQQKHNLNSQQYQYHLQDDLNQQNQQNQQAEQQQEQQEEEQPEYGEVDGQKIKLAGLDYQLINQQKEKERKNKIQFIDGIRNKIGIISGNVFERVDGGEGSGNGRVGKGSNQNGSMIDQKINSMKQSDKKYQSIVKILQNNQSNSINNTNTHKKINKKSQTYLIFQLDQFTRKFPTKLQKRIGKGNDKQIYINFDDKFMSQFSRIMQMSFQNRGKNRKDGNFNLGKMQDEKQVKGRVQQNQDSDDDDIFGNCSDESNQQQQDNKEKGGNQELLKQKDKNIKMPKIQIGKKLDFGIQQDIFAQKRANPIPNPHLQQQQKYEQQLQDKYFFIPNNNSNPNKKIKTNNADDGYGQCYHQSGPSLKDLVDMKKQGIQYYGDLKEFKQKERKAPNLNREYEMVQKIIEKKSKGQ